MSLRKKWTIGDRLVELRSANYLTQRELARRSGVPNAVISVIERNQSSPSVDTLRRILEPLSITMAEFFEPAEPAAVRQGPFIRGGDLTVITRKLTKNIERAKKRLIQLEQVGPAHLFGLQLMRETYLPGADSGFTTLRHAAATAGLLVEGQLQVTVGEDIAVLDAGDGYIFDGRIRHRFRNMSGLNTVLITASSPPYL
jgi:transcriptional regulator with XRE-family HTH domain